MLALVNIAETKVRAPTIMARSALISATPVSLGQNKSNKETMYTSRDRILAVTYFKLSTDQRNCKDVSLLVT